MPDVANLTARLRLDDAGFGRGMNRAARAAARFATVGIGIATAAVTAFTAAAFRSVDATAKSADMLGETTERMAGFRIATALAGVEQQNFTRALQRGQRRIAEAAQGTGEAVDALGQLGLSAAELVRLSPGQQLQQIAGALQEVGNANERARLLFDLFGRSGQELINVIKGGAESFDEAQQFADQFGLALSRVDAAKIEDANDQISLLGFAFEGVANQLAVRLAPLISEGGKALLGWAADGTRAADAVNEGFQVVQFTVGRVIDGFDAIRAAAASIQVAFANTVAKLARASEAVSSFLPDFIGDRFEQRNRLIAESFEQQATEASERAAAALERIWGDDNQRQVDRFFGNAESRAAAAADKVAELAAGTAESTRAFGSLEKVSDKTSSKTARERSFQQFDPRFVDPRGLGGREQQVRAPQLDTTNARLDEIRQLLARPAPALFT